MTKRFITDGITSMTAGIGTDRDKATSVYYTEPVQDDLQILAAYRTSWLAKKIVDIPAHDSFRRWRSWQADEAHVELLEEEEKRLDLKAKLLRTETLARLYGGAALYFDLGDDSSKPLPKKVGKGAIRFCTVLSHRTLIPGEIEDDPLQPNFGSPKWYTLGSTSKGHQYIHPSRLVLRYGTERPDLGLFSTNTNGWGDSVLYALMPAIQQFDGTAANLAALVYESKIDVISVKGLMTIVGDPVQEAKLLERYRLAAKTKSNNGMLILDGDAEDYQQKSATFTTLPDILDRFGQNAAGGSDIPMTRLFGTSPAGLNSTGESDLRNYYDGIAADQELRIAPAMHGLDETLIQSALGSRPPEVHYIWSSLWQISDQERVDIGKGNAEIISTMQGTGLFADEVLSDSLVNMMVESSVMPGLEAAVEKYGAPVDVDEEPLEESTPAAKLITDAAPQPLYVCRRVTNTAEIKRWAKSQGYADIVDDLHATIAFSRTPLDWMAAGESYEGELVVGKGGPRLLETFGEAQVLLFASDSLKWRHERFIDAGASWDHPDYQPHITISYGPAPTGAVPYTGRIEFGPEEFAPLKVDTMFGDAQPRAPKGTPTGGQWVKGGGGSGGVSAVDAAAASVATKKYDAEAIKALTNKKPGDLSHYEKKVLAKYKKALEAEKAKTPAKEPAKKKTPPADSVSKKPTLSAAEKIAQDYKDGKITVNEATEAYVVEYGKGTLDKGALTSGISALKPLSAQAAPKPLSAQAAQDKALASVATKKYPVEKIKGLMNKDPADLSQYEKKKLNAYKKALLAQQAAGAPSQVKAGGFGGDTMGSTMSAVNPKSAAAQADLQQIAVQYGHGMNVETVEKLASGEWQPQPGKAYQADVAKHAAEYLKTGKMPTPSVTASSNAYKPKAALQHLLASAPPPVSDKNVGQQTLAKIATPLTPDETNAAQRYTGNTYKDINNSLRTGSGNHSLIPHIDSAVAKTRAAKNMVVVRGIDQAGMSNWLAKSGGELKVGATLKDKGYVSTTRSENVAGNFAGYNGYGFKIEVPKGAKIMPLKSISSHAQEDEFLLPRGSDFKVKNIDGKVITLELLA